MARKNISLKELYSKQLARARGCCLGQPPRNRIKVKGRRDRLLYLLQIQAPRVARTLSPSKARKLIYRKARRLSSSKVWTRSPPKARTLSPPKAHTLNPSQACTLSPPRPEVQDPIHVDTTEKDCVHVDAGEVSGDEEEPQTSFDDSWNGCSDTEEPVKEEEGWLERLTREGVDIFSPMSETPHHLRPPELTYEPSCRPAGKRRRRMSMGPDCLTWPPRPSYHPASPESEPGDGYWPFPKPTKEDKEELRKERRRSREFDNFFGGLTRFTQEDIENFQIIRWLKDDEARQDKLERDLKLARLRMRNTKVSKELEMLLEHLGDKSKDPWPEDILCANLDRLEKDLRDQIMAKSATPGPENEDAGVHGNGTLEA